MEAEAEADRTRLERRLATLGVAREATLAHPDATLRPGDLRRALRTAPGDERATTTAPFLPSITLGEAGAAGAASAPSADLLVAELLGEGGMGAVHLAEQRSLARAIAIKRPLTGISGAPLIDEARTMARVEHPHVVPVHALGRDAAGSPVLVMKRVSGASLRDLLRDAAHPLWPTLEARWGDRESASLGILADVADALGHAHAQGVVHRDVKPENVMVGAFGEVYLLDWGIALRTDREAAQVLEEQQDIIGTPGFMAPEMILDPDRCDARTDVYLLGATLHQVLTGTLRHRGETLVATLAAAIDSVPIAYGADVAEDLAALANACTHRDPASRPPSAAAFRRALLDHGRHREALGLVRSAREALAPLAGGAIAVGDPEAEAILFEARSLLAAATRGHAACAALPAARGEWGALAIERDLVLESPGSARAHLAELPAPRPDLEARIDALEERLARAKASEAEVERARADADTSSSRRTRTIVLVAAFTPLLLMASVMGWAQARSGAPITVEAIAATNVMVLALLGLGVAIARRRLLANRGNRTLTWLGLGGVGTAVLVGFLAVGAGSPTNAALAYTHAAIAAYCAAGALTFAPELALVSVCSVVFAALLTTLPDALPVLSPLGVLAVIVTSIFAMRAHAHRAKRAG